MNKILFPLKLRMQGPTVADLQHSLRLLLDRSLLLRDNEDARRELAQALKPERDRPDKFRRHPYATKVPHVATRLS
jgi:hypothetical protein